MTKTKPIPWMRDMLIASIRVRQTPRGGPPTERLRSKWIGCRFVATSCSGHEGNHEYPDEIAQAQFQNLTGFCVTFPYAIEELAKRSKRGAQWYQRRRKEGDPDKPAFIHFFMDEVEIIELEIKSETTQQPV